MKHLKMLGLAVVAVAAMVAFVGASSASASVLFKYTTPNPNDTLAVGTEIDASLVKNAEGKQTALLTNTEGNITLDTCTESTIKGKITSNNTPAALGSITALTWGGCVEPTETSTLGEMEISNIAGTTNGTLKAKKTIVKVNTTIFGAVCEYTAGESLDLGTLVGAKSSTGNATIDINTVVPAKNSFFCPDARWKATYSVTSPTGLTVES